MDLDGFGCLDVLFPSFLSQKVPFQLLLVFCCQLNFWVEVFYIGPEGRKLGKSNLRFCPEYQKFVDCLSETKKTTSFFRHVWGFFGYR